MAFNYCNGITIGVCRRISKFLFNDYFVKADKNDRTKSFDVYLNQFIETREGLIELDYELLEDYKREFQFNPIIIPNKKI